MCSNNDGPRIGSAPRRKGDVLRSIRGTYIRARKKGPGVAAQTRFAR
ncbi:hypothetical protein SAMN05443247_10205 [Bradyrhizobium erythrophlei]|nr:hypothetical protein SAMN05443247_10205 [Bradyrhizobium erythrophlei]